MVLLILMRIPQAAQRDLGNPILWIVMIVGPEAFEEDVLEGSYVCVQWARMEARQHAYCAYCRGGHFEVNVE